MIITTIIIITVLTTRYTIIHTMAIIVYATGIIVVLQVITAIVFTTY